MATQPWGSTIRTLNKQLTIDEVVLNGSKVFLKVRARPNVEGLRPVDAVGLWDPTSSKVSTRACDVAVNEMNYARELPKAYDRLLELVAAAADGVDTRQQRVDSSAADLPRAKEATALAKQLHELRELIDERRSPNTRGRRCGAEQYERHIKHLRIIEGYLVSHKRTLTGDSVSTALLHWAYDGNVSRKNYRDACILFEGLLKKMGLPCAIPKANQPTYKYVAPTRDFPEDGVICERLKAIKDPEEQKLVYACVVYGRRNSELWSANWDQLGDEAPHTLPIFAPKNMKTGLSWQLPFGDEQIDLKGFKPPRWNSLKHLTKRPEGALKDEITKEAGKLSELVSRHLGCTATDMRHRWGSEALTNPKCTANSDVVARAMCTSVAMLERTYTMEMLQHQQRMNFNPMDG